MQACRQVQVSGQRSVPRVSEDQDGEEARQQAAIPSVLGSRGPGWQIARSQGGHSRVEKLLRRKFQKSLGHFGAHT